MPNVDTKDWKLTAVLDYTCKTEPIHHVCKDCGGSGTVGGGFKCIDGPRPCSTCYGAGGYNAYEHIEAKPAIPAKLVEHMRKAYQEYLAVPDEP